LAWGNPTDELGATQPPELEMNLSYHSSGSYDIPITVGNSSEIQNPSKSLSLSTTLSNSGTNYYGSLSDNMVDGDETFYTNLGPLTESSRSVIVSKNNINTVVYA